MLPPYNTTSSPSTESKAFENASVGLFTQLYYSILSSWKATGAFSKLIYPFLVTCLACYEIYCLCTIYSETRTATKATENLAERYSEYKSSYEGLVGITRSLSEVIQSLTSGSKATVEANKRAIASGTSVPTPEIDELLKALGKTQEAARECTRHVGVSVCSVTRALCNATARAID